MAGAMRHAFLLITALLATALIAQEQPNSVCQQRMKFSAHVVTAPAETVPVTSSKALVHILREGIGVYTIGAAVDGAWVGATKRNTHFSMLLEPGEHHLCSTGGIGAHYLSPGFLSIRLEAGKTYYIEQVLDSAINARDRVRLIVLDPDQGEQELRRSRTAVMTTPESRPPAADVRNR